LHVGNTYATFSGPADKKTIWFKICPEFASAEKRRIFQKIKHVNSGYSARLTAVLPGPEKATPPDERKFTAENENTH
jgi:hypothetical protein